MKVIDLTHPISNELPVYFPWHPATTFEQTANYREHRCIVHRLSIGTHSGTHIDAPSHVLDGMGTMDEYNPDLWYRDAVVVDVTPRQARQAITAAELQAQPIGEGMGVILKTGWDVYFGKEDYYKTYPPLSNEGAEYLAGCRIAVLAADTPFTLDVHYILLKAGIPLITNLRNTGALRAGRVKLIAAPLLIKGGDGAPARVMAITEG